MLKLIREVLLLLVVVACVRPAFAAEAPDYAGQVAPLLKRYCNGCHNAEDKEGKLVLEQYAGLLAGGEHGPVLVPGKSGESRLIRVLTGQAKPAMPPEDEAQPTKEEIALLAAWIDAGAHGPIGAEPDPTKLSVPKITPRAKNVIEPLTAAAISPSDEIWAAARYDKVQLAHRADQTSIAELAGHRGRVTFLGFSPAGDKLLAASGEPGLFGEVRIWNVADRQLLQTLTGHRDSLYAAVMSPDSALIATASYDQSIKLWNAADGRELRTLSGHNDAVYDLAFRPDGKVLASVSGDRTLKLWETASGRRLDTLAQSLKELYTVAFEPNGERVAAAGVDGRIRVWQVHPQATENQNPMVINRAAHEAPILRLLYSRDGSLLISASEDRTIKLWDGRTLAARGTLETQPDWPAALALSPDGGTLLVGRLDGTQAQYPLALDSAVAPAQRLPEFEEVVSYGDQPPIDQLPKVEEVEPNDVPAAATAVSAPGVGTGVIRAAAGAPADVDLFRFAAKAGDRWVVEVNASRSGVKLDSRIEVLHADGRPVQRLLLRAIRDSELEFRSEDSSDRGIRFANWEELPLNGLMFFEGEVIKHYRQRRGPDADSEFYPEGGARFTYYDTSPRAHALGVKSYIVEPYAVGTQLPYNGLPVFPLYYANDDDGERKLGNDSKLTFTAPANGDYLIRVSDVRGFGGDDFKYQLIVRRPQPDFSVKISDANPIVPAGSGKRLNVFIERSDGFWGEVRVDIAGLPIGFSATTPIIVQAGHRDAHGVLLAHPDAANPNEAEAVAAKITATATIAGREVTRPVEGLGKIQLGPKPKILVHLSPVDQQPRLPSKAEDGSLHFPSPAELRMTPGTMTTLKISVERNGFTGIINFEADNLPHGVIVDDIGLSGIEVLEGQTERLLYLSAERWVPEQDRPFQLYAKEEGVQVSAPLVLQVRQEKQPASAPVAATTTK